jgi:hypothetical protein
MKTTKPRPDEYAPYYEKYVSRIPDGDVVTLLTAQAAELRSLFANVPDARRTFAYAPGKWTLAESLLHVADCERVFAYRVLRIARGDTVSLHAFDENAWAPLSGANDRPLADIAAELAEVRAATIALLKGIPDSAWTRVGTASDKPVSVRALAYIIAGHAAHHAQLFREKYLD